MRYVRRVLPVLVVAALAAQALLTAQNRVKPAKRPTVPPPRKWDDSVRKAFFDNALDQLVGSRPDFGAERPAGGGTTPTGSDSPAPGAGNDGADGYAWSALIAAETLEGEIKTNTTELASVVSNPGRFKGGTYKDARRLFSTTAVMLGIIARYDGEVRWQEQAELLCERVGHAGFNCKVGTDQSHNEAKLRQEDLNQLLRGGNVEGEAPAETPLWSEVSDRPPLMQRMDAAKEERLLKWTASTQDLNAHREEALREAQLLAAFARVIQDEGYESATDEAYLEYARQLQAGALEVIEALKADDVNRAQAGMGNVTKACNGCHGDYKG
jgi:hypothetical protein